LKKGFPVLPAAKKMGRDNAWNERVCLMKESVETPKKAGPAAIMAKTVPTHRAAKRELESSVSEKNVIPNTELGPSQKSRFVYAKKECRKKYGSIAVE